MIRILKFSDPGFAAEFSRIEQRAEAVERRVHLLDALQEAANENPDLTEYLDFHRTLYEALASAKAAISASLAVGGYPGLYSRVYPAPMASHTPLMIFSIRCGHEAHISRSKVRVVPLSRTVSGMIL